MSIITKLNNARHLRHEAKRLQFLEQNRIEVRFLYRQLLK